METTLIVTGLMLISFLSGILVGKLMPKKPKRNNNYLSELLKKGGV